MHALLLATIIHQRVTILI